MIPFNLSDVAPILNAKLIGKDRIILSVTTNSKVLSLNKSSMFIALKGKNFDAHVFAKQAVSAGAIALLVNQQLPINISQLVVADTYHSLKQLSAWVRQQSSAHVIAITGSSGKTSVKEMTAAILRQCGQVLATKENFNNKIGVPLTLLRLTPEHNFAVIELGSSHVGEIARMVNIVQPKAALVNNISAAHLAGFGSMSRIAQAKGEIFTGLVPHGRGIINFDSHDWTQWHKILDCKEIWRFSLQKTENVDFFASNIISNQYGVNFILHTPHGNCNIRLNLLGRHNISNALAASALALSVGAELSAITTGLSQVKAIPGRLFPIMLSKQQLLLDDSYNSNVGSMIASIQVLMDMPGYRVMVVGDMADLGNESANYHIQLGNIVALSGIDKVLSIGDFSYLISDKTIQGEHFQDKSKLIIRLTKLLLEKAVITILVKGSRNAAMEKVVHALLGKSLC